MVCMIWRCVCVFVVQAFPNRPSSPQCLVWDVPRRQEKHTEVATSIKIWVVVSDIFYFHPYLGRFPFWLIFFKRVETTNQNPYINECSNYTKDWPFSPENRHGWKSWNLKILLFPKGISSFFMAIFRFHVSFRGCMKVDPRYSDFQAIHFQVYIKNARPSFRGLQGSTFQSHGKTKVPWCCVAVFLKICFWSILPMSRRYIFSLHDDDISMWWVKLGLKMGPLGSNNPSWFLQVPRWNHNWREKLGIQPGIFMAKKSKFM